MAQNTEKSIAFLFCSNFLYFGPNLPDVWVPREHTPPHTLFPESLQCKFYDVNLKFYDPLKPLLWSVYINMFYFLFFLLVCVM